jgi:hypothetical protein
METFDQRAAAAHALSIAISDDELASANIGDAS